MGCFALGQRPALGRPASDLGTASAPTRGRVLRADRRQHREPHPSPIACTPAKGPLARGLRQATAAGAPGTRGRGFPSVAAERKLRQLLAAKEGGAQGQGATETRYGCYDSASHHN